MNLFRAPAAARALKTLDRSLFLRSLPTSAACVKENKFISKYRKQLEKTREILLLEKFDPIAADPDSSLAAQGRKCLILNPRLKASGSCVFSFWRHDSKPSAPSVLGARYKKEKAYDGR